MSVSIVDIRRLVGLLAIELILTGGTCLSDARAESAATRDCGALGGMTPGLTIHEVIAQAGSPDRVYLSGADAEGHNPKETDDLVFVFSGLLLNESPLIRSKETYVSLPFATSLISLVRASLVDPTRPVHEGLSPEKIVGWLGNPSFKYRIPMIDEGPESSLGNCVDERGSVEMWVYLESCLQVYFHVTPDGIRAWLSEVGANTPMGMPAPCAQED